MPKSIWKTVRDDKDAITITNRLEDGVIIRASRTNPAPKRKWQGWNVTAFDNNGRIYYTEKGLDTKKQAVLAVRFAKFKWESANVDRYRLA